MGVGPQTSSLRGGIGAWYWFLRRFLCRPGAYDCLCSLESPRSPPHNRGCAGLAWAKAQSSLRIRPSSASLLSRTYPPARRDQTHFRMTQRRGSSQDHFGKLHGHCQRHGRDSDAEHAGGTNGPIKRTISMPVFLVYVGRLLRASSSAPRTGSITPGLMAASRCSERRRL